MDYIVVGIAVLVVVAVWASQYFWPRPRIIREHERGLRYHKGTLVDTLGPGRYWLRRRVDDLVVLDMRKHQLAVAGQEVLTKDRVPIKLSLLTEFSVTDPRRAISTVRDYEQHLYGHIQLAVRESIAGRALDDALADRGNIGAEVRTQVSSMAEEIGLTLHSVQVRDYMMAGGLRNAYSDVIAAKQQGLAALERARGESAALRSLANSAQLLERHPGLVKLRVLQALEAGSDSRIVISMDGEALGPKGAAVENVGDA